MFAALKSAIFGLMIELNTPLNLQVFNQVLFDKEKIRLAHKTQETVASSYRFLKEFADDKIIYGVNTGFGPMAQYKISDQDRIQLQYNLIRSHATGMGEIIPPVYAKAALLARLQSLSLGNSGVHPDTLTLMQEFINRDILPVIYQHGGVGASGDLVQLAHMALNLIGEGQVFYKGQLTPAEEAFEKEGLSPLKIALREGLALMNGTSVMTGIGIINSIYTEKLVKWSTLISAFINELVKTYDDHLSQPLHAAKKHKGQLKVAQNMREILKDSKLIRKREEHLYQGQRQEEVFKDKLQEYYSLRCVPQILGPILDTLDYTTEILVNEVNSANDNPIVDLETKNVYHGGNFHGDYVALEMDKLRIAVTKLTMLAERQLNYLLNVSINEQFPPFVNLGRLGLNFGMQGAQFTATSTTAENQALATPMYIHSIPNNKDNQDIVSMGTNSAWLTKKVIDNAFEVLAIHILAVVQATDSEPSIEQLSSKNQKIYSEIREILPTFKEDLVLSPYLHQICDYLKNYKFEAE